MTSDGSVDYPRGTESKFVIFDNVPTQPSLPYSWIIEHKITPKNADDVLRYKERYSCESRIELFNAGLLTGVENFDGCKELIATFKFH